MSNSGNQQGTEGFKAGNLKRQLETIPIAMLDATVSGDDEASDLTQRLWLTGLNGNLKVMIACGVQSDEFSSMPFPYVADPGTIQLYPCTKFPDSQKVFLRPVFQDPTNVLNVNAPLPQQIPYGWEAQFTEADQVMIEVIIHAAQWATQNVTGNIVVQVTVEYNGAWWDVDAIEYVMGQVQLNGSAEFPTIGTGGGG